MRAIPQRNFKQRLNALLLCFLFLTSLIQPAYADLYTFSGGGGGGGGSGTVGNGNAGEVAYYNATGTTVIGNNAMRVSGGALTMGIVGSSAGSVVLSGATSGTATIKVAAAAGTGTIFQLPANNGTSGQFLQTDGAGITSWQTVSGSGTVTSVAFTGDGVVFNAVVPGSPVTVSGTFAPTLKTVSDGFFLGNTSGGTLAPTFQQVAYAKLSGIPAGIVIGAQSGSAGQFVTGANGSGTFTYGTPAGAVTSVTNVDGTLTISPTTGAVVASIANNAPLPGAPTTTTAALGDNSTKVATTAYFQNNIAAFNPLLSVDAATAAVLPNTPTYSNGTGGVGATLTAGSNTTLTVDGFAFSAVGQYCLVKNQATSANNGVYQLTQVGSGAAPWILTRATNFNATTNMNHSPVYWVINGTANISTEWGMTSTIVTVGSTSMTWTQLALNPSTIQTTTLGNNQFFIGDGSSVATARTLSGDVTSNNTGTMTIGTNVVSNAKFRQSAAISVVGNSGSSTANVADITASAGGQVLNSNNAGTAIAFTAAPQLGVNGGTGGSVILAGSTSGTGTIQVAAAAGTATVFQIPATNGTNGYYLQTNGSGVTSWQPVTGSGTVNSGTAGQLTYYAGTGTVVSGNPELTVSGGTLTIGDTGSPTAGAIILCGSASGTCTIQTAGAAGSTTFQLPANNGTNGYYLQTNGSGVTSWQPVTGSGTVNSGTAGQMTYYAGTGTVVSGNANATISSGALTLGQAGSVAGSLILSGVTSGTGVIQVAAAAGSGIVFQIPSSNGSSGQFLQTNGSGVTSWQTVSGSGTVNSGTANQMAYYASTGTAVSGNANVTVSTGAMTLGVAGAAAGSLILSGATSGTGVIQVAATAGSGIVFQLPSSNGSNTNFLQTNGSGVTSWAAAPVLSVSNVDGTLTISPTTGAVVASIANNVALPGNPTTTTQSASDNSTRIATTAYVTTGIANAIAAVNPAVAVTAATTGVLPNSPTYSNGASGIGATLTAGSNTTLTVDGVTFSAVTQSCLVKNQASAFQNGVYNVTQVGSGILPWILTRRLDYDQPSDINDTGAIPVVSGTVNTDTSWLLTSRVNTVGTDALTYVQFTINPATIATTAGGTAGQVTYFASTGNAVSGSANFTVSSGAITLGQVGSVAGSVVLSGSTSGTCTVQVAAVAGTATVFQLPATNGTNGFFLQTNGSGITTWASATGSGTVNSGTAGQLTYYASTGTAVSGNANATISAGALTLGVAGTAAGSLVLSGVTSGTATVNVPAVAGTVNFTLPPDNGTNTYVLQTNGSGVTTWVAPSGGSGSTVTLTASETLSAGNLVNIYDSGGGTVRVRKADNTNVDKFCNGFVLSGITSGASGTVNFGNGLNTAVTSLNPGSVYFLGTSGGVTTTAPSGGNVSQIVGNATAAGVLGVEIDTQIVTSAANPSAGSNYNGAPGGRLTLTTNVPVTTSDVTAATTLYYTPYLYDTSFTYVSSAWVPYTFTQKSVSVPAQIFRLYDVFDDGTTTPVLTAWDSGGQTTTTITGATAANPCVLTSTNSYSVGDYIGIAGITGSLGTTASTGLNGKVCRVSAVSGSTITLEGMDTSGLTYTSAGTTYKIPQSRTGAVSYLAGHYADASNRLYLGSFMTTSTSGQTEDSASRRLVWNQYNRLGAKILARDTTSSWSYSVSTTIRPSNATTSAGVGRVEYIVGFAESPVHLQHHAMVAANGGIQGNPSGIGINTNVATSTDTFGTISAATGVSAETSYDAVPSIGYTFAQRTESQNTASAQTYYGGIGSTFFQSGLTGYAWH